VDPVIHIVDDDAQVRAFTSYLLAGQGYRTEVYSGVAEFLAEARLGAGCILLDLRMPDMDGLQALAEFPRHGITLPVIMISGRGDVATAVKAMKLGAVDFIEKPYDERELVAMIERALDSGERERAQRDRKALAMASLARLSSRERQILQGLLAGMTNKAIARRLELSPRTVEMHRANMMEDLGFVSLSQALHLAIDCELAPLDQGETSEAARRLAAAPRFGSVPVGAMPAEVAFPPAVDIFEGATDCAILLDSQWRITFLNGNAIRTIARGKDLVGEVLWDVFPLSVGTTAWERLRRSAERHQAERFDFFAPDLDLWFDVSVRPIPSGTQIFFRDTTSERKLSAALRMSEEALNLALKTAEQGSELWNAAAQSVSIVRELNQPLTAISDFLTGIRRSLAGSGGESPEELLEALEEAEQNVGNAAAITRRLLDPEPRASAEAPERLTERVRQSGSGS
jgi:FixJ family two-component response regulator